MSKLMKSIVLFLLVFIISVTAFAQGEGSITGTEQVESLLNGEKFSDNDVTGDEYATGYLYLPDDNKEVTFQSEHGTKQKPMTGWEPFEVKYQGKTITPKYKYRVVGNGSGPTYIYITGYGNYWTYQSNPDNPNFWLPDKADAMMDNKDLQGYNMLVVSCESKGIDDRNERYARMISHEYGDEYRAVYGESVAALAQKKFPGSSEYVIVGHSLGGCGIDSTYAALKKRGITVKGTIFADGLFLKGGKNGSRYFTENLEADGVPMVVAHTLESQGQESIVYLQKKKGIANAVELDVSKDANTLFSNYVKIQHGSMMYSQMLIDAIKDMMEGTSDESKKDNSGSAGAALKDTQASLQSILNNSSKTTSPVKSVVKTIASSAISTLSNLASIVTKSVAPTTQTSTATAKATTTTATTAKTSTSKPTGFWVKTSSILASRLSNLTKATASIV